MTLQGSFVGWFFKGKKMYFLQYTAWILLWLLQERRKKKVAAELIAANQVS